MTTNEQNRESLIKEYEAAQDMIKHYDDLTMRFGTMTHIGVLIFLGLVFGLLGKEKEMFVYLFPFVILFVILLSGLVYMWFQRHRSISQIKIQRILEIEKQLGWKQFSVVDEALRSKKMKTTPIRKMLAVYHLGLPVILIVAYFIVLYCS